MKLCDAEVMSVSAPITIVAGPGHALPFAAQPTGPLRAYHLRTEAEKGEPVDEVPAPPDRYRAEIEDPGAAFRDDVVLLALAGGVPAGCLVLTAAVQGRSEVKRLRTEPGSRGRGVASRLIEAALDRAERSGTAAGRLSVWDWRTGAVALHERLGFAVTRSWETREGLVRMERDTSAAHR